MAEVPLALDSILVPRNLLGFHDERMTEIRARIRQLPEGSFAPGGFTNMVQIYPNGVEYPIKPHGGNWIIADSDHWLWNGQWCEGEKREQVPFCVAHPFAFLAMVRWPHLRDQ